MNTTLPLLSLLPNSTYGGSPSFGDGAGLGRGYDYVNGSDGDSGSAGQSIDFSSYGYTDDFGIGTVSHQHYQRTGSAAPQTGNYPHLVQPDFSSHSHPNQYRADHHSHHHPQHHHHNGDLVNGNGDAASRFLDLDLSQPGPSTYRHTMYTGSDNSPDVSGYGVESRDDVKTENGTTNGDDNATEDADVDNEEPLYVNAKQYHRILKRRLARARLEELNRLVRSRKPYLHESRHRHACSRPRGKGGRFLTADEIEQLKKEEAAKAAGEGTTSASASASASASVSGVGTSSAQASGQNSAEASPAAASA